MLIHTIDLSALVGSARKEIYSPRRNWFGEWTVTANLLFDALREEFINVISKRQLDEVVLRFSLGQGLDIDILPFEQGAFSAFNLFAPHEILVFARYFELAEKLNFSVTHHAVDVGANIGVHSIILKKLGFQTISFEPNPLMVDQLKSNLIRNKLETSLVYSNALTGFEDDGGSPESLRDFTIVKDNLTASTLVSAEKAVYGPTETIRVPVNFASHFFTAMMPTVAVIKLDCEGSEYGILSDLLGSSLSFELCVVEINKSHRDFFQLLKAQNSLECFSDLSPGGIFNKSDLPSSWREGSLFLSRSVMLKHQVNPTC